MDFNRQIFRHVFPTRVRSYQVDRQNVVHQLCYFYYFEEARVEYLRALGFPMDRDTFVKHDKFFVAKNTCEYVAPAFFDDELEILSRIVYVRNTSIGFEHAAIRKGDGTLIAVGTHVLVSVDKTNDEPVRVGDDLRENIRTYEGVNVRWE